MVERVFQAAEPARERYSGDFKDKWAAGWTVKHSLTVPFKKAILVPAPSVIMNAIYMPN